MVLPVTAWAYAVRAAATALVGVWCLWKGRSDKSVASPNGPRQARPPRLGEAALSPLHGPGEAALSPLRFFTGLIAGVLVTVLWIVPEISSFYRTWFCWPLGSLPPAPTAPSPYDPAVCGWSLTVAQLVGSAFVIAPVEEGFFRSFLYRWLQNRDFRAVPLSRVDLSAFLWTIFLFTLEHDRPLAAALAGAITAHVTTNLLLALHVIFSRSWSFW